MKKKFPIFGTIFTLLAIAALCGLGKWQLDRLAWKTEILRRLEQEYARDAANTFLAIGNLDDKFDYKRGTLRGAYEYGKQVRVGPRPYENTPGYQVLTPLRLADGSYIIVNRGWVPQDWTEENDTGAVRGETAATGLLRLPDDQNPFMPPNDPAKGQWYYTSPAEIAAAAHLGKTHPYVLYLENDNDLTGKYPIAAATKPDLPNNHLMYAVFWFAMAGALAVIYIIRFFKKG